MTTIITKNSSTAGAVPIAGDLVQGEIAVNVTDKKLYTKNASGSVVQITPVVNDNGFKNRLINGAMVIDQRNAGASVTPTASGYTIDRWKAWVNVASKFSVQQTTSAPAGFINSLGVTSTSAYTIGAGEFTAIGQSIEGLNVSDFGWGAAGAQSITVSFWVRSSLTGTFGGSVTNSAGNRSYPFTFAISAANTWEQKSVTIAGDTSGTWLTTNGTGLQLFFGLGCGSSWSGTAGAWNSNYNLSATGAVSVVGTSGATLNITGVQLEKSSTATSFDYRPYGTELMLCQRYYCKSFDMALQPSTVNVKYNCRFSNGNTFADVYCQATFGFPVSMRTAPTVTTYSGSTTGQLRYQRNTGATVDGASGGVSPINEISFNVIGSYSGSGSNSDIRSVLFDYTASAEL